jgi:hypothetical protein
MLNMHQKCHAEVDKIYHRSDYYCEPEDTFHRTKQESITKMTFNQLKAEAKRRGITMASTSTKQDLIKALS